MSIKLADKRAALLIDLNKLIDSGKFKAALTKLNQFDEQDFIAGKDDLHVRFLITNANIMYNLQKYQQALDAAEKGLDLVKSSADNKLIAELQSVIARSYTELGEIARAERVYHDLISTYRRLDDFLGSIRTLNRLARVFFIKGEFGKAIENLIEARVYAGKISSERWQAMIAGNIGTIFNLTGQFKRACEHLEDSVKFNKNIGNGLNLCRAYLSLAYAQYHLKDFDTAKISLDAAAQLVNSDDAESEKETLHQYLAEYFLFSAEYERASENAEIALKSARECADNSSSICQSERILAEIRLKQGNLLVSLKLIKSALRTARKISEQVEVGAALRVLADIQFQMGHLNESSESIESSVNILTSTGANFELAESYLTWSKLSMDAESTVRYRMAAEDVFRRIDLVKIYLPKRNSTVKSDSDQISVIGESRVFQLMLKQVSAAAQTDIPLLLQGETGTGKDLIADFVHENSPRRSKPFVSVNCAAIPLSLAESELFGYQKGAFTNALNDKEGLIEIADGGTLFLNEVGELPLELQAKLLTVLDEKKFYRLGAGKCCFVDFRLIAATNVNLEEAVAQGKFRSDLYYRLAVFPVKMPRLSERGNDAFLLFKSFMEKKEIDLSSVNEKTLETLEKLFCQYDWPGNVREIQNNIDLYTITEKGDAEAICFRIKSVIENAMPSLGRRKKSEGLVHAVEQLECSKITEALYNSEGVIRRAAAELYLPEATLRSKMKKYHISAA